jgi:hypothetical protein
VKVSAFEVPPDVVTVTLTAPAPVVLGGESAVIVVGETTFTWVAGLRPKSTTRLGSPVSKPVPVMVTGVPPPVGP